jgi:hypothetical protein
MNPSPYRLHHDPNTPSVDISTLGYMDDTNLISSSTAGLQQMLARAQEFYQLNNTKINFNKAILICNRNPVSNNNCLPDIPSPCTFDLGPASFDITPLKKGESFRFLGVWFNMDLSPTYVKRQCTTEYRLFTAKLRNKRLTGDQVKYLHNGVLLPRVAFRLKCTLLSEKECNIIMAPMKKVLKHSLKLVSTIPDAFIHYKDAIGLQNLFEFNLTNHVDRLSTLTKLGAETDLSKILSHRLSSLSFLLHLDFPPSLVTNFKAFSQLPIFKQDYILRTLAFSSKLGISFKDPSASDCFKDNFPLFSFFHNNPSLYNKSLYLFKKYNIHYLNDCVSDDGLMLLPYKDLKFKVSGNRKTGSFTPKWYNHIKSLVTVSPVSLRLKEDFKKEVPLTYIVLLSCILNTVDSSR